MYNSLYWLAEFLDFARDVMLPFTPRLISAILPNLAHHVPQIQTQAQRTNQALMSVIQSLPSPSSSTSGSMDKEKDKDRDKMSISSGRTGAANPASSPPATGTVSPVAPRQTIVPATVSTESHNDVTSSPASDRTVQVRQRERPPTMSTPGAGGASNVDLVPFDTDGASQTQASRSQSPTSTAASIAAPGSQLGGPSPTPAQGYAHPITQSPTQVEPDPFDYLATVNALTVQFISEFDDTRVAALKWLIMLHQKAPKKVALSTFIAGL